MTPPLPDRRRFLFGLSGLALTPAASGSLTRPRRSAQEIIRPPRLKPGDRVGLVNPATAAFSTESIEIAKESLEAQGLEVALGPNYFNRRGYLAGTDVERASDIMGFVNDPQIRGIWARGGWGSARVLPHLDYEAIRANPKVFVGFSDSTALLNSIYHKSGLVTFHGAFPRRKFVAEHQRPLLFDAQAPTLSNPVEIASSDTVQMNDRTQTLAPGRARGRLLGGNLTVLSAIVGTPYLPDFKDAILFLEDVGEAVYRIDRMFTQLALSGVLSVISGFVFGRCTDCPPGDGHGSLTLEDVLRDHIEPLGIPAFRGSMIGHIKRQFTLPIGAETEMDADAGTLRILHPAVI